MLAYAAARRAQAERPSSPQTMLAIAVAHVAVIAVVMSAKMDVPQRIIDSVTKVELIEVPKPPPPPEPQPRVEPRSSPSVVDRVPPVVPVPQPRADQLDPRPVPLPPVDGVVVGPVPQPYVEPRPAPAPVRVGPRFATPDHLLRPPYPPSKMDRGEEAELRLRLAIDERGRVTSVDAVGRADPVFLRAARRHLTANWRYRPATEDGRPIPSSTVITLRFELES